MSDDLLFFCRGELRGYLAEQEQGLLAEIEAAPEEHVLQADAEAWAHALVDRFAITSPQLGDTWMEEPREVEVDVSHEHFTRAITDPSTPTYIPGYQVVLHLPFEGDPLVFDLQASTRTLNPPRGSIEADSVTRTIAYPHDSPRDIDAEAQVFRADIEKHLAFSNSDLSQQRTELDRAATQAIARRRERIDAHRAQLARTNVPIGPPGERDRQSIVEAVVRRPSPAAELAPAAPIELQPALEQEVFEHILGLIRDVGIGMERTPATYLPMDEEARRDVFLTNLNTHYRGRATAEAFNVAGKTDLLISYEDKNLFIGECKIWSGAKAFTEAIDQLFSYTAWRDTRLALIVFVEQKKLTEVIAKARAALSEHPEFHSLHGSEETELRAEMSWPGDPERRIELAVLFVHLPA